MRSAVDAVAEMRQRAPQIVHLDGENDIGLADQRPAEALIERMPRREVHAAVIVDHRALQRLGEFDEVLHARGRARHAVADDERILGRDQHLGGFDDRRRIALRRNHGLILGDAQAAAVADRVFLQLAVKREEHRPHRRRGRDLVGAHHGLAEMLQRGGLVVPLGELAHQLADIDAGMQPFGARRALVGLHDIAAEHDDRHAVAPRVVHRHGGVLQTDHAVARHGNRLAFHLGIALAEMWTAMSSCTQVMISGLVLPPWLITASCRPR